MSRTFVIIRHTFLEAVVQPIYSLLVALGAVIILIFNFLPFFTLGEDTIMFISVALDVILLLVLIATLFATSRSIYEEIEDRTMLTLMSKPVRKWEVLAGKYLGIILSALLAVTILGAILCLCVWWRVPGDYSLQPNSLDDRELRLLAAYRQMHLAGVIPSLLQLWLQICTLAAVGVALSTRFSLVVNLPIVILVYLAGNLTRFLYPIFSDQSVLAGRSIVLKIIAYCVGLLLPTLEAFDLKPLTVYSKIAVRQFSADPNAVHLQTIWTYVALSAAYAVAYVCLALSVGMWLFRRRELGGSEG